MSAIAGVIYTQGQGVDLAALARMQGVLAPYGRDAQHHWHQGSAALIHTLLRTTPEDALDRQPLVHPASGLVLVFDGRIDNRDELALALGLSTPQAALMADSALVLEACLVWGRDAPTRFVGDYALACWSPREQRLWLARSPLGQRPLSWYQHREFFAFASLPKALFALPGVPRALCEERVSDLLMLLPMAGPESFFKDVYNVEPGHVVTLEAGQVSSRPFHRFDPNRELHLPRDDDYVDAFREHFERAVASCLRTHGPVASHLSSGFDSSSVAALAARQLGQKGQRLLAYTAAPRDGYNGPVLRRRHADESVAAGALVQRFDNIDHVVIRSGHRSPLEALEFHIEAMDRTPLNPCNLVWMNAITEDAAARGAKVLLNGQMGNMSISYTGEPRLPALMGTGRLLSWRREAAALRRQPPGRSWRGLVAHSVAPYLPGWLWQWIEHQRDGGYAVSDYTAIHPAFMARMRTQERARRIGWDTNYRPWADGRRMRIASLQRLQLGDEYAAANLRGLDWRDPTSDLRLVEFCLSVPDAQYLHNGQIRWLLQRAMKDVLPTEITQARTKGLQAADWHEGLEAAMPQLKEELRRMAAHGTIGNYLDLQALQSELEAWTPAAAGSFRGMQKYRLKLLRGLAMGTFIRYVASDNR